MYTIRADVRAHIVDPAAEQISSRISPASPLSKLGALLQALLCVLVLVLGTSASASAQATSAPPACCTGKARHIVKYENGVSAGRQKAEALFAATDVAKSPAKLRKKLDRVLSRLYDHVRDVLHDDVSDGRRCRVQGLAEGFLGRLSELLGECILDGAQWGQFSATLYCDLSLELGGLGEGTPFVRAPAGLCGSMFEQMCDGSYSYVASGGARPLAPAVTRFLQQRGVTLQPYPACAPYTEGAFAKSFEDNMSTDCAYGAP